jgi:hypothetical protein
MTIEDRFAQHHKARKKDDTVVLKIASFNIGDVEDVDIYFGAIWWDYTQHEKGEWVKQHALDLVYHSYINHASYTNTIAVTGVFSKEDALIYKLKWGIND